MRAHHPAGATQSLSTLACALACALLSGSAVSATPAVDEAEVFKLLTCNYPVPLINLSGSARAAAEHIEATYRSNQNGKREIPGPFRSGDACIKDIRLGGMLGIIEASGKVCDRRQGALVAALEQQVEGLRPRAKMGANDLHTFEADSPARRYAVRIYQGEPVSLLAAPGKEPETASKTVSFACAQKETTQQ